MTFRPEPPYRHGTAPRTAVLLVNLGTPAEPTAAALRTYLAEFLSDPRVVEIPSLVWLPILHGIILRVRPAKSAAKYASIWTPEGSPLAVYTQRVATMLQGWLGERGHDVVVRHAMRYGQPSVAKVMDTLRAEGATRVLVVPLYPQYAGATTASVIDAVTAWARRARQVPELRFVNHYHDDPTYIDALAERIEAHWAREGRGRTLVMSFHGVPHRTLELGDPYHCECHKTARLLARRLGLADGAWVSVKRVHGDEAPRPGTRRGMARVDPEVKFRRRLALALWTVGAAILAFLAYQGWDYYGLDRKARLASELHETMKPAGTWGHGVGIVATLFMMSNFLYPIRKRWVALKASGTIRTWLTFHMFVGFMSPLVIAFHAAFQSNNTLATLTAGSLLVVVATGVVGRFIYGLVPSGRESELVHLAGTFELLADKLEHSTVAVARLLDRARTPPIGFLPLHLAGLPLQAAWVEGQLLRVRVNSDPGEYLEIRYAVRRLFRLRTQVAFFSTLRRLLSGWRVFHAGLAIFLVLIIAAHIGVSLYLGYGWIFF